MSNCTTFINQLQEITAKFVDELQNEQNEILEDIAEAQRRYTENNNIFHSVADTYDHIAEIFDTIGGRNQEVIAQFTKAPNTLKSYAEADQYLNKMLAAEEEYDEDVENYPDDDDND